MSNWSLTKRSRSQKWQTNKGKINSPRTWKSKAFSKWWIGLRSLHYSSSVARWSTTYTKSTDSSSTSECCLSVTTLVARARTSEGQASRMITKSCISRSLTLKSCSIESGLRRNSLSGSSSHTQAIRTKMIVAFREVFSRLANYSPTSTFVICLPSYRNAIILKN